MTPEDGQDDRATPREDVWDWVVDEDGDRYGRDIFNPRTRWRWSSAMFTGGLPYLWNQVATVPRQIAVERLELRPGDRVLVVGEAVDAIGFDEDVRRRGGELGEVVVVDIRDRVLTTIRNGHLAQWEWDERTGFAEGEFDCVFVAQAVAHAADWTTVGAELLRTMRSGRRIVLAASRSPPPSSSGPGPTSTSSTGCPRWPTA